MKYYVLFLLLITFVACKKEPAVKSSETAFQKTTELLTQQWQMNTFQILEQGYDHSIRTNPSSGIWSFKKDGAFVLKECADCPAGNASANWVLSADSKKITVVLPLGRKLEYAIISLSSDKLVVQATDFIGPCGVFETTGQPGWAEPACATGLVQYELAVMK